MRTSALTTTSGRPSTRRQIAHHVSKLGDLGFEVTLCRLPGADPDPSGPGNTQAA